MGGKNDGSGKGFFGSLTREQKLTAGIVVACGVVMFALAVVQIRRALTHPFTASLEEFIAFQRSVGPSEEEQARRQQQTDTDGDGMSDWQELNVYKTSPYLSDSDSDGVPDNIEIARGTDPNCAEGELCAASFGGTELSTSTGASAEQFGVTAPAAPVGLGTGAVPPRDPASIRTFLKLRGMSEADLAGYSDEDILAAYDAAASGQMSFTETQTHEPSATE